jgi:hypothetical protein
MPQPKFRASHWARFKAVFQAYPFVGLVFLFLAFWVTVEWFISSAFFENHRTWIPYLPEGHEWAHPLVGILGGLGAFLVAAILIFRRVFNAEAEADSYGFTRALAIGYYFNFIRPLTAALRDINHPLHREFLRLDIRRVAAVIVGLPGSISDCHPNTFHERLADLAREPGIPFELHDIDFDIEGHPRPVRAKLAVSVANRFGIFVDIPTTLAVLPEFAEFVAQSGGPENSEDEAIARARREVIALGEIEKFALAIDDFQIAVVKAGAQEPLDRSPAALLQFVDLSKLRRRLDELAGHP